MNSTIDVSMHRFATSAALAALVACPAAGALAQDKEAEPLKELSPVEISRKKNSGDLRYHVFLEMQSFLLSLMPPEPRVNRPTGTHRPPLENDTSSHAFPRSMHHALPS